MTATTWLLLLLLIVLLQPVVSGRFLTAKRRRAIQRIEAAHGSRLILLVHHHETVNLLGIPVYSYIDIEDSEQVLRAIRQTDPERPIEVVLHTPGGFALAALQIGRALRAWPGEVTVYVPHYAMSGGTLIALAADRIVMTEHALLGPVDPQIDGYPAASVLSVLDRKPANEIDDETLILADISRKAITEMRHGLVQLLVDRMGEERADRVARTLTEGLWTHDQAISLEEAQGLGLPVEAGVPDEILDLMALYERRGRGRPTVEYLRRSKRPRAD